MEFEDLQDMYDGILQAYQTKRIRQNSGGSHNGYVT
jgi:hypothetical protein